MSAPTISPTNHATATAPPPLTIEVSASVAVEEAVDLIALFSRMGEREQKRYHALDAHKFSIAAEWERPLAYLWPDEDDLIPLTMAPGAVSHPRGNLDDSDVRVISRNGERPVGVESRWGEADYLLLAAAVEWLAVHAGVDYQPRESTDGLLRVEVTATFGVEETLNPFALFTAMTDREQERYFALDLTEVGMSVEWERPLAYLWPDDDDLVPHTMVPGSVSHPSGMVDNADVRVVKRFDTYCVGAARDWTDDDYRTLVENVPWLARHAREQTMSEHDRARLPGPDDVPLFD